MPFLVADEPSSAERTAVRCRALPCAAVRYYSAVLCRAALLCLLFRTYQVSSFLGPAFSSVISSFTFSFSCTKHDHTKSQLTSA